MSSTTAVCPRCLVEVAPDATRCQACNQVLKRPAFSASATSVASQIESPSVKLESETSTGTLDRGTPGPPNSDKLRVKCACGVGIRVSIALRGKRVKCPKCSAAVIVPVSQVTSASSDSQVLPAIDRPSSASSPTRSSSSLSDSSIQSRSAESAVMNRPADDQVVKQAIESAAKLSIPEDAVLPPQGRLSSLKLRKIRKTLEMANVLSDADTVARRQSLLELGQSQDSQVLEILVENSQDTLSMIREGAITALGELGDPAAVPTVLRALLDRDADVIRAAFASLKKIGDRRIVRPLLRYGVERPQWKPLANDTLVRVGPRVTQELLSLLHSNDAGLMLDAIVVLGRIGDKQAVPTLIACLNHVSDMLKAHVAESLALIGDPGSMPHLLQMLQGSSAAVRANAASGLVRMVDQRAFRPLLNALQDEDADVRRYAANALGELGESKAVPELLKVLQGWDLLVAMDAPFVEAVVETVGKLGDASAAMGLLPLLQSKHDGVMLKTVLALKKLRSPSAIPALTALLDAPQPTLRRRVVETLGHSGDVSQVPVLGEVLRRDASREVRATAARSLGELKSHEACPFLEEALREEFSIRCQAVIALGQIQERSTLAALMAMLRDEAPEVRYHAINAIAKFKDPKTLKALAIMLEDADPMVRSGASKVIDELGGVIEDKTVKDIVRRARMRDSLGKLIPKWAYLLIPQTKAVRSAIAGVLAACLLLGFIITTTIGGAAKPFLRGNVASLTISADGNLVVAERTKGMIEIWDVEQDRVLEQIAAENVRAPVYRANEGVVLLSGESVVPWNLTGTPDRTSGWKEHETAIVSICGTPDGKFAATCDGDSIAVVWDLIAGKKIGKVDLNGRFTANLSISPVGDCIAASNALGQAAVWEVATGELIKDIPQSNVPKKFTRLAFSPDGNWLVGAEQAGGLRVWNLQTPGKRPSEKQLVVEQPLQLVFLRFLSDSKRLLLADAGCEIRMWNIETEESKLICSPDLEQLSSVALRTDEKQFVVGGGDNREVLVFELESGKLVKTLDVRSGRF